jgi:hypothetical protein
MATKAGGRVEIAGGIASKVVAMFGLIALPVTLIHGCSGLGHGRCFLARLCGHLPFLGHISKLYLVTFSIRFAAAIAGAP